MKWIELHIKCSNKSDQDVELEEMGVNIGDKIAFRPFSVRVELIDGFYVNADGGCYVFVAGMELVVQEDYDTIKDFIHASQL